MSHSLQTCKQELLLVGLHCKTHIKHYMTSHTLLYHFLVREGLKCTRENVWCFFEITLSELYLQLWNAAQVVLPVIYRRRTAQTRRTSVWNVQLPQKNLVINKLSAPWYRHSVRKKTISQKKREKNPICSNVSTKRNPREDNYTA